MFCEKCGAENKNDAKFCEKCGAPINKEQKSNEMNATSQNRKVGIIAVAVCAIVVVIVLFNLFGGRGYESTVKKYFNATMDGDAKAVINLIPKKVMEKELKNEGYDEDEMNLFIEEGEKALQDTLDSIESAIGDDWKMSYEIEDDEDITGKDLKEIKEDYEDYDIEISEAKEVEVKVTVKAKDNENSNTTSISLIKIGRSWYLDVKNMGSIF